MPEMTQTSELVVCSPVAYQTRLFYIAAATSAFNAASLITTRSADMDPARVTIAQNRIQIKLLTTSYCARHSDGSSSYS